MSTTEDLLKVLDPPGSCLYHYTRLDTVVAHILPSGRMHMNSLAKMRDPRESKELNPVARSLASDRALERSALAPLQPVEQRAVPADRVRFLANEAEIATIVMYRRAR